MLKDYYINKYNKEQKGRNTGNISSWKKGSLKFGNYGIKILENGFISYKHLEAIRRIIVSTLAREGQIWFYSIPNRSQTKKAIGDRMGSGTGGFFTQVLKVKKGLILFEFNSNSFILALKILRILNSKLPLKITGICHYK